MGKGFLWWMCLLGCVGIIPKLAAQTDTSSEIERHYKLGQEALQSKQDDVAEREFREILRLNPNDAAAHANLGLIAFNQKHYAQAALELRAAFKLHPSLWNAEALLGLSEFRLGNTDEAKAPLEDAFRHLEGGGIRAQVGLDLATIYQASNDLGRAIDVLRALGPAPSDDPAVLYLAYRTYSGMAAQQLARLTEVAPDSVQMHEILAQALASHDDFQGAIAQYRKALEVDPQFREAHFEIGQLTLAASSAESARRQAEQELKLALAADPKNADCNYLLGEIEWLRSNPQEALKYYREALALRPAFVDAHIAAGRALSALGQPDEAIRHFEEAIRLDPESEVAHYRLSEGYRKLGRAQDAEHELATFRKLRDSHATVRALYQQVQERPVREQTVDPNEPQ